MDIWDPPERASAWPLDTQACVFLGRIIDRIGGNKFPNEWTGGERVASDANSLQRLEQVHSVLAKAIEAGELELRARLVGATENRFGVVNPTARTPEGWIEAVKTCQVEEVDRRPWIPVRQRRRIPQAHWLFVTKESLDRFFKGREKVKGRFNETSARAFVKAQLQQNPSATMDAVTSAAQEAGKVGARDILRKAYTAEQAERGISVRQGRRSKSAEDSAKNSAKK